MGEPAEVIPLPRKGVKPKTICPEKLSQEDARRLLVLAQRNRFTLQQVPYAWLQVYLWADTNGRMRRDWVKVAYNAMRQGWALRGYKAWWKRRYPEGTRAPSAYPGTKITPERIETLLAAREKA